MCWMQTVWSQVHTKPKKKCKITKERICYVSKFKIGDVVTVLPNITVSSYDGCYANEQMVLFAGKSVTISAIRHNLKGIPRYILKEDHGRYMWSEEMFEDKKVNDLEWLW